MVRSVTELAEAYGIKNFKIFFATDSPMMTRLFKEQDSRVFGFDEVEKEADEGKGFIMPGWQGWGRSPGMSDLEKFERCEGDAIRAFLDMTLLGYVDLLVISKKSSFTFFPSVMMAARRKPACQLVHTSSKGNMKKGSRHQMDQSGTAFTCRSSATEERRGLAPTSKEETGLAPSSRRMRRAR
mmetsp:Transcript_3882/g.5742  ORF Transcript_3882/g.5742 Transcript_3882/m.5742 type:complete len:183 (+) Transcript_3882:22-570(+)